MIKSYRRIRRERASAIGRKRGLASQRVQAENRLHREVDADTMRQRALHDARGRIVREGATFRASGMTHWLVRRSITGRVDQFDFVADGVVKLTAGPRKFPVRIRPSQ